jgi:hypothetical protein
MPIPTLPLFLLIHTHTTTISSFLYSLLIRRRRSFCLSLSNGPLTKPTLYCALLLFQRGYYTQCAITISGTLFNCPAQQFWGLEKPTAAAIWSAIIPSGKTIHHTEKVQFSKSVDVVQYLYQRESSRIWKAGLFLWAELDFLY